MTRGPTERQRRTPMCTELAISLRDNDDLPTFERIHRKKHPKLSSKKRRHSGHQCLHKKRYATNGEAMRVFAKQIINTPELRIYHCPDCHGWHLTHKPQLSTH